MNALGAFVAAQNLDINISDAMRGVISPSLSVEATRFNPEMVTWLTNPETQERTAIITRENIAQFAEINNKPKGMGERIINALGRHRRIKERYMALVGNIPTGLKAESLQELVQVIKDPNFPVTNFGQASINLLEAYSAELFADPEPNE